MEKYNDFLGADFDISEQGLNRLFVKRTYERAIQSLYANDIIIGSAGKAGKEVFSNPENKISTLSEREGLKEIADSTGYQFPENSEQKFAQHEINLLNPNEVEDYYIAQRVRAYLNICRAISLNESVNTEYEPSWRRVYSFILAQAYHHGRIDIKVKGKKKFAALVKPLGMINASANTIYQTVISAPQADKEKNFIYYFNEMKGNFPDDYNYAMSLFSEFFPDIKL